MSIDSFPGKCVLEVIFSGKLGLVLSSGLSATSGDCDEKGLLGTCGFEQIDLEFLNERRRN